MGVEVCTDHGMNYSRPRYREHHGGEEIIAAPLLAKPESSAHKCLDEDTHGGHNSTRFRISSFDRARTVSPVPSLAHTFAAALRAAGAELRDLIKKTHMPGFGGVIYTEVIDPIVS